MSDGQKIFSSNRVGIFGPVVRNLMSKVIKTKPEIHEMNQPLRGMPALKQIRSSKRQEALWPKLSPTNGQILVGATSSEKMEINGHHSHMEKQTYCKNQVSNKNQSTLLKNQAMVIKELNENANRNTQVSHQSLPDVDGENTKDVTKLHQFHDSSKTDLTGKSLSRDQLLEKSKKSPSQKRKDKKDDRRGRGLHSVKKQRQANRESIVSSSMRALTPRERESILCLEEAIQQHDMSTFAMSDDENVFEEDLTDVTSTGSSDFGEEHYTSDSEGSSVGSVIDLVGNLSLGPLSSSSSAKLSDSQQSDILHSPAANVNWSNNAMERNITEVDGKENIDAKVDKKAKKDKQFSFQERSNGIKYEPICAVVQKEKPQKKNASTGVQTNQTKSVKDSEAFNAEGNEEPTAMRSRMFWDRMSCSSSGSSQNQAPSPRSKSPSISSVTDQSTNRKLSSNSENFEDVTGCRGRQFLVIPRHSEHALFQNGKEVRLPQRTSSFGAPRTETHHAIAERKDGKSDQCVLNDTAIDSRLFLNGLNASSEYKVRKQTTDQKKSPISPNRPFVITPAAKSSLL